MRWARFLSIVLIQGLFAGLARAADGAGADPRALVALPAPMQRHMLASMRDHLRAIHDIQSALGQRDFDKAADIAESRLGMSSLAAHDAAHMAPHMPKAMQDIGSGMHRAASRFARAAQEAAVDQDLPAVLEPLAAVTRQCVACHSAYRLK